MKRLLLPHRHALHGGVIFCSLLLLAGCKKTTTDAPATTNTTDPVVTVAIESTAGYKGLNWG